MVVFLFLYIHDIRVSKNYPAYLFLIKYPGSTLFVIKGTWMLNNLNKFYVFFWTDKQWLPDACQAARCTGSDVRELCHQPKAPDTEPQGEK